MPRSEAVAIVGMACLFPGAPTLQAFFRNLVEGKSAISDVPPGRWDPVYYAPESDEPNRFRCKRGGFIDEIAYFDPAAHGVMPVAARRTEPDQLLTLEVACRALRDAGLGTRGAQNRRTGVVLGRGGHGASGHARAEQDTRGAEQLVAALESLFPTLDAGMRLRIKHEFQKRIEAPRADGAIGMIPNLTASRIAHHLDFHGAAYTVDGACASALLALDHAVLELQSGRADLMLTGGVHVCHTEAFWSVFHHLGALSRSQTIRPFDRRADGLLIGEGVGIMVLKREQDALRHGDRIYALVRGVGVASDGTGSSLVSPSSAGQLRALEHAWTNSGVDPRDLMLLEAHGTGTPIGDAVEVETVHRFFGAADQPAVIGSVKSMIGHTMAAAGAAGMIKTALAIFHGVLPPTLNCEEPRAELTATRLRALSHAEPWGERPKVAAVSAFGFGGINGHVVLTASGRSNRPASSLRAASEALPPRLALFAADDPATLVESVERSETAVEGTHRLAVLDPSPERLRRACSIVRRGARVHGEGLGIFYSPTPLLAEGGKLAFVFPGMNDELSVGLEELADHLGETLAIRDEPGELGVGLRVLEVNHLLLRALQAIGFRADLLAGHSLGEWSALAAAGMVDEGTRARLIGTIEGTFAASDTVSAALFCGAERALGVIGVRQDVEISHDNCPTQVVICGSHAGVAAVCAQMRAENVLVRELRFSSGVHTSRFDKLDLFVGLAATVEFGPAHTPVYSGVLAAPYPYDQHEVRTVATRMLVERVRFAPLVEALYDQGARVFIQVGGGPVTAFVRDVLGSRAHLSIPSAPPNRAALAQLTAVACSLWVEGRDPEWSRVAVEPPHVTRGLRLSLGVPLVRFDARLTADAAHGVSSDAMRPEHGRTANSRSNAVAAESAALYERIAAAQYQLLGALTCGADAVSTIAPAARVGPPVNRVLREISLRAFPELADHAFYPQPEGWADNRDRQPVMPLTGIVELMMEAARAEEPYDMRAVAVSEVEAYRWLAVAEPVHAMFTSTPLEGGQAIEIEGFARGKVQLAGDYPPAPPAPSFALEDPRAVPTAASLYADRFMFHGPAYRGMAQITGLGRNGIRGQLRCGNAVGALLDSAAQLFGIWFMHELASDRLAMPVRLSRARFYGPRPAPGTLVDCLARPSAVEPRAVIGELILSVGDRVWAHIEGWEARRLEVDDALWRLITWPEKHVLAQSIDAQTMMLVDRYRSALTQDYLRGRYLRHAERARLVQLPPAEQRAWLNGRVVAKDLVRAQLWRHGAGPLFPAEVLLHGDGDRLRVIEPAGFAQTVRLTHEQGRVTAALAQPPGNA